MLAVCGVLVTELLWKMTVYQPVSCWLWNLFQTPKRCFPLLFHMPEAWTFALSCQVTYWLRVLWCRLLVLLVDWWRHKDISAKYKNTQTLRQMFFDRCAPPSTGNVPNILHFTGMETFVVWKGLSESRLLLLLLSVCNTWNTEERLTWGFMHDIVQIYFIQNIYNTEIHTNSHTADSGAHMAIMHIKPHSWSVHHIKLWDLGIKLLTCSWWWVRLGRGGCISCRMRDETWGGFISQTDLMESMRSASQSPSYSMPVEHWFSTLLAHMIPPFLRGKLPG